MYSFFIEKRLYKFNNRKKTKSCGNLLNYGIFEPPPHRTHIFANENKQ